MLNQIKLARLTVIAALVVHGAAAGSCLAGEREFIGNALCFTTREEAEIYLWELAQRWTAVREVRITESDEPANYMLNEHGRAPCRSRCNDVHLQADPQSVPEQTRKGTDTRLRPNDSILRPCALNIGLSRCSQKQ